MAFKSQMVGHAQQLQAAQTVKETEKGRETEKARDSDPESTTSSGSKSVVSTGNTRRTGDKQQIGKEQVGRLGRGPVSWDEQEGGGTGTGNWLPPNLQPQSKTAGSASNYNIPYWLLANKQEQDPSPQAAHQRLLNGLRSMVGTEIQQYTKANDPPYSKKTLRDIYGVLNDGGEQVASGGPGAFTIHGDPSGYSSSNAKRASSTLTMLESPPPPPGGMLEMVA